MDLRLDERLWNIPFAEAGRAARMRLGSHPALAARREQLREELAGIGCLALMEAARRWDPECGVLPSTYLIACVRLTLRSHVRPTPGKHQYRWDALERLEDAGAEALARDGGVGRDLEDSDFVSFLLAGLCEDGRRVVWLFHAEGVPLSAIARRMGWPRHRAERLLRDTEKIVRGRCDGFSLDGGF